MRWTYRETKELIIDDGASVPALMLDSPPQHGDQSCPAPGMAARIVRALGEFVFVLIGAVLEFVVLELLLLAIAGVGLIGRGVDRSTRFAGRTSKVIGLFELTRLRLLPPPKPVEAAGLAVRLYADTKTPSLPGGGDR